MTRDQGGNDRWKARPGCIGTDHEQTASCASWST